MSRIEVASSLAPRPKGAYISRMVLRSSRGRPQNTPAAFIVIVATLLIAAVPVCAQAQSPSVPRVSKGDAQRVVAIISGDKAKTETYCEIMKLGEQIGQAYDKKDGKMVAELFRPLQKASSRVTLVLCPSTIMERLMTGDFMVPPSSKGSSRKIVP